MGTYICKYGNIDHCKIRLPNLGALQLLHYTLFTLLHIKYVMIAWGNKTK